MELFTWPMALASMAHAAGKNTANRSTAANNCTPCEKHSTTNRSALENLARYTGK